MRTRPTNKLVCHPHKLCETLFELEGRVGQLKKWGIVGLVMTASLDNRVLQAQASEQPFLETFSMLLQDELDGHP